MYAKLAEVAVEETDDEGLVKEEASFPTELKISVSHILPISHRLLERVIPGHSFGRGPLGLLFPVVAPQSLTNLNQLRLDVLNIENPELRPNNPVEYEVRLVPDPDSRWNGCVRGKGRGGVVSFQCKWLKVVIRRKQELVICLKSVRPRNIIIWTNCSLERIDARSQSLVVLRLGKGPIFRELGLYGFLPLRLSVGLSLRYLRRAVFLSVTPPRREHSAV